MRSDAVPSAKELLASLPEEVRTAFSRVRAVLLDADGVMSDGRVIVFSDGSEAMSFDVRDGSGLWMLHRAGVKLGVVTGRTTGIPEHRARSVPIDIVRSGARKKDDVVREILADWGIPVDEAVYVGDDILDGPALRVVGVPVCVADAVPEVKRLAVYVTQRLAGRGAVREVADLVLEASGDRDRFLEQFLGPAEPA